MELKRVNFEERTSQAATDLQHEVVRKFDERNREKERRERALKRNQAIRKFLSICVFLAGLGGIAYFVWNTHPEWLGLGEPQEEPLKVNSIPVTPNPKIDIAEDVGVAKAVEKQEETLDAYGVILKRFSVATLDYWKNAPASDKPQKGKGKKTFLALFPMGHGASKVIEIKVNNAGKMAYSHIRALGAPIAITAAEFTRATAKSAYLILIEDRCYFCTPGDKSIAAPIIKRVQAENGKPDIQKVWQELGIKLPASTK